VAEVEEVAEVEDVVELGEDAVVAVDSGVIDLGADAMVEEEVVSDSKLQSAKAEGENSSSGRDLIAEAVESGVEMELPEMELVEASEDSSADMPALTSVEESSAVDLGSNAEITLPTDSDALAAQVEEMEQTPSSSGVTSESEELDLETLMVGGDPSSKKSAPPREEDGTVEFAPEELQASSHDEIDLGVVDEHTGITPSAVAAGSEEIDLAALMAKTDSDKAMEAKPDTPLPRSAIDADTVDLGVSEEEIQASEGEDNFEPAEPASGLKMQDIEDEKPIEDEVAIEGEAETFDEEPEPARTRRREEPEEEEEEARPKAKPRSRVGALVGGTFLGLLLGAGGAVGLYKYGDEMVPEVLKAEKPKAANQQRKKEEPTGTVVSAADLLKSGELDKVNKDELNKGEDKTLVAQWTWENHLQKQMAAGKPITATDAEVKEAEETLKNTKTADALFLLGQIQELTGRQKEALATYTKGKADYAKDRRFQAAINRLELSSADKPAGNARLDRPGVDNAALLALLVVALQEPVPMPTTSDEAGFDFWDAAKLARQGKYDEAIKAIDTAKSIHDKKRFARLRKAQNPMSDPNEEIFLRTCDELKLYWQLQDKLKKGGYFDPAVADKKDPVKAVDAMVTQLKDQDTQLKVQGTILDGAAKKLTDEKIIEKIEKPEDFNAALDKALKERKDAGVKVAAVTKKLTDDKIIEKPEDLDKGVDKLIADHKDAATRFTALGKKLVDEKVVEKFEKPDDLNTGVDALIKLHKDDEAKLKTAAADLTAKDNLLKQVGKKLEDGKFFDPKGVNNNLLQGLEIAVKTAGMKDPAGEIRTLQTDLNKEKDLHRKDVAQLKEQATREVADITEKKDKELTTLKKERDTEVTLLKDRLKMTRQPTEMMAIWLPMMREGAGKDVSEKAANDAILVLKDEKAPPELKARANLVLGLALRNQEKFAEARPVLEKAVADLKGENDLARAAETALKEVSQPAVYYTAKATALQNAGQLGEAVAVLDRGIATVPDARPALLAQRSLLQLEAVRARTREPRLNPDDPMLVQARKDADEASNKGKGLVQAQGQYANGRIAEEVGDWNDSIAFYRKALATHPELDDAGSRFRVALARVLIQPRQGGPALAPPPKEEEKKEEKKEDKKEPDKKEPDKKETDKKETDKKDGEKVGQAPALRDLLRLVSQGEDEVTRRTAVLMLTLLQLPGQGAPQPDREEALRLADEILRAPEGSVPFDVRAQAYMIKGLYSKALVTYAEGLRAHLSPDYANGLMRIVRTHPVIRRPDSLSPPNPFEAENRYAAGLRYYYARDYEEAEKAFQSAVDYDNQDARYFYFLGLAKLMLNKAEAAEDFEQGARLEKDNKPSRVAVSNALERIQGPARRVLNEARNQAR
jgi:tetratricopeptide (TPR) repeat protein